MRSFQIKSHHHIDWRSLLIKEEDETVKHLLGFCPELAENGRRALGREFFDGLEWIADLDVMRNFAQA